MKVFAGQLYSLCIEENKEQFAQLQGLCNIGLPLRTTMKLMALVDKAKQVYAIVEPQRRELIKKHGTVNEETKMVSVAPGESLDNFLKEYSEILKQEIEVDLELIPGEELDKRNVVLSEPAIRVFGWIIAEFNEILGVRPAEKVEEVKEEPKKGKKKK
jgi:hypothetical protein